MENNEFKKVGIKNRTCYYFDDIIKLENFDFNNILIYEKSYKNILIYDFSHKDLINLKLLRIRFDKTNGFLRIHDGTRYLTLFDPEKYEAIYGRTRYLVSLESGITYIFSPYFMKIKIDSYDSLLIGKILTLHNVIILINSVLNKDKNY